MSEGAIGAFQGGTGRGRGGGGGGYMMGGPSPRGDGHLRGPGKPWGRLHVHDALFGRRVRERDAHGRVERLMAVGCQQRRRVCPSDGGADACGRKVSEPPFRVDDRGEHRHAARRTGARAV